MPIISYALNIGLNDVPDDSLDPEVWAEMNKIFLAIKAISDSMDSGVNPGLLGTPGSQIKMQNYSVMWRQPTVFIPAGSTVMFDQGVPVLTSSTKPYADGFTENDIAAGTPAPFIMCGLVYYPPGGLTIGARYYVNNSVPGAITTATGGKFVGQAFSAYSLFFDPQRY